MRVFLVEPYYAGSHQAWADGWRDVSGHEIHLLTMEGRFWKWRMHGGPVTLAREAIGLANRVGLPDVIVASSMLDLATFLGLAGRHLGDPATLLYMHENQLTYPLSPRTRGEDLSYAFVNWRSMLAADQVVFNTEYHRSTFFEAVGPFLKNFPDNRQLDLIPTVADKSAVLGVGIPIRTPAQIPTDVPLILWNQRWEYDKNPVELFDILNAIDGLGIDFRLALTGENFRQTPTEFEEAMDRFGDRIVQFGFADPASYDALVASADLVLSTAHHEFFGVSVAEAMAAGAFPILPRRLSYPEIVPEAAHAATLYDNVAEAVHLATTALTDPNHRFTITSITRPAMQKFSWDIIGPAYDSAVEALIHR